MRARIVADKPLIFDDTSMLAGGNPPKHVRGGAGMAEVAGQLVILDDGDDCIAVVEGERVTAMPLRVMSGSLHTAKGNLNLEAVMAAKDWRGEYLLAFGSGVAPEHRAVARVRLGAGNTELSVFETQRLYRALAEVEGFAENGLDVQGAARLTKTMEGRDGIRLFNHGGGPPIPDLGQHHSSTVDLRLESILAYLDRCKRDPDATLGFELVNPRSYHLDDVQGVPFAFTDAAATPDGAVMYLAVAQQGDECLGTALGVIAADGSARYTLLAEKNGGFAHRVAEGMAMVSRTSGYLVVQEKDDQPAVLATFELSGL